jgi:hypothetical protein
MSPIVKNHLNEGVTFVIGERCGFQNPDQFCDASTRIPWRGTCFGLANGKRSLFIAIQTVKTEAAVLQFGGSTTTEKQ